MATHEKEIKEENPFSNIKFLDDIKETTEYKSAKERIDLIQDIFSLNEENFPIVMDELKKYLIKNDNMVPMFILVTILFILTRYKAANKFGFSLLKFFIENYLNEIENLINMKESLYLYYRNMLNDVNIENLLKYPFLNYSFYNFEQGTIPYFLLNDDIEGLQNYVSGQNCVDFNEKPTTRWIPTTFLNAFQDINIFEYSILFGSIKCFKFIMLQDGSQITPECIAIAVASGNTEIIRILEQKDVHFDNNCFDFSLIFHQNNVFEWLIRNHANNLDVITHLIEDSILYYNEEIFYFMLKNGISIKKADHSSGLYPIQDALLSFNIPFFKYLFENYYQDLNLMNDFKFSNLFQLACKFNQIELVKYFFAKGRIQIELEDEDGYRPIHFACLYGSLPIVEYLVSQQCDPNPITKKHKTPFVISCTKEYYNIAEYLLKHTQIDINSQNVDRQSILGYACSKNDFQLVKFLIDNGYDPSIVDLQGKLPYFVWFNKQIVKYIATSCKDKLPVDSKGRTFLHYSALHNSEELVKYFISLNIDKDSKDQYGMTPLHFACSGGSLNVVSYLISVNADKESIDKFGRTPLHYAFLEGHKKIYDYLISIGADKTIKDINGMSPLDLISLKKDNYIKYMKTIREIGISF